MSGKERSARSGRRSETESALVEAARHLFSECGYDGASVTEIGRRAGVSHTLINAYFDGKAGLAWAIMRDLQADRESVVAQVLDGSGGVLDKIRCLARTMFETDLADRRMLQVLQGFAWTWSREEAARNEADLDIFGTAVLRLVEEGRASGELPPGWDAEVLRGGGFAIYHYALRRALLHGKSAEETLDEAWPQLLALFGLPPQQAGAGS
ncbi:TetR/AcrR family transcriptional regulator [Mangrovicoccus ximenensis]|uniref:TetR/AcrR family transcriptional regulator n=1 Tax=Mangrovicoccus ximenensis TaxID=1911570 RepID=UPI001374C281|nr:TetR/AcrR family transcriptional regulator [Mangrovicoccus ximenensis]